MPKKLDYPQASFSTALEIAEATYSLGGNCSKDLVADKIGQQATSGAYKKNTSAAVKYNLIEVKEGKLSVSKLYKDIQLAYTHKEKKEKLQDAFFSPPIFKKIYLMLKGKELPKSILNKMLIKEFGVEEESASRVAKYFIDGLNMLELLKDNKVVDEYDIEKPEILNNEEPNINENAAIIPIERPNTKFDDAQIITSDKYIVHFVGPGMDSKQEINELDDIVIVEAILNKIRKKLSINANN